MNNLISIGKLALTAGVSTRTIRYYEEVGILSPAVITDTSYRLYGSSEEKKLRIILLMKNCKIVSLLQ